MKKITDTTSKFFVFTILSFPWFVQAQSQLDFGTAESSFYIAPDRISLLQSVFGISTKPEVVMIITIITIIGLVGFLYVCMGLIVFLLFINKN